MELKLRDQRQAWTYRLWGERLDWPSGHEGVNLSLPSRLRSISTSHCPRACLRPSGRQGSQGKLGLEAGGVAGRSVWAGRWDS